MSYSHINGHRTLVIIVVMIVFAVVFSSCDLLHVDPSEEIYRTYPYDVHWLTFSLSGYENEREIVRDWYTETISEIEIIIEDEVLQKYYISLYDFNGDGNNEIIAFVDLSTSILGGARASGYLTVFTVDAVSGEVVSEKGLAGFALDNDTLETTEQVGVLVLDREFKDRCGWIRDWIKDWMYDEEKGIVILSPYLIE